MNLVTPIRRAWHTLAPKLVAFLAGGGITTAGIAALAAFAHITIDPTVAAIIVGGIASIAAIVKRDNLLQLGIRQLSVKVVVLIITSASATSVVAIASALGTDLTPWSPAIGLALTALGGVLGYAKTDTSPTT